MKAYGIKDLAENYSESKNGSRSFLLPRNKDGALDEWHAIERQKQRTIEAILKEEKEKEKTVKRLYG